MQPSAAYTSADVPVVIVGEHFEPRALQQVGGDGVQVDATFRAFLGDVELRDVRWEAVDRLTATVPAGLAGGPLDLRVVGPTGEGIAPAAFRGSTSRPAALTASLSAPALVEQGTEAGVDLFVGNSGEVPVASPAMELLAGAGLRVVAVPGAAPQIDPGQTIHYVALISADARGPADLALEVAGQDGFTGTSQSAGATASILVVTPPQLVPQPAALPQTASVGQNLDLAVDVTNSGDVDAVQLSFGPPQASGPGAISFGPPPAPQDVPSGAMRTFHFPVQAASPGFVSLSATGVATDRITGRPVQVQVAWTPVLLQLPAQLVAQWLSVPGSVAPAQIFTAALAVANLGEATARAVLPSPDPPDVLVTGGAGATGATARAPLDVPGGGAVVFQWPTFTASGPLGSTLQLRTGAAGQDGNSGATVTASAVTSPTIEVQNLTATLAVSPAILRGDAFTIALQVGNAGAAPVVGIVPSPLGLTGAGSVSCGAAAPASMDLPAFTGSGTFTWSCNAVSSGQVQVSVSVSGTESGSGAARNASATALIFGVVETLAVASNPLGDGTASASLTGFAGRVYLGPRASGAGAVRLQPDGSAPEAVSFSFAADSINNQNGAPGPYPTLGARGCEQDSLECGPDNEDGRGFFGSNVFAGVPWLLAGGARTDSKIWHVYASTDVGAAPSFSYVYVRPVTGSGQRTTSLMTSFGDLLIVGFGRSPMLLALRAMPTPPGLAPTWGTTGFDLAASSMPAVSNGVHIDAAVGLGGKLHVFNSGGCARANAADPTASGTLWVSCTPSALSYLFKSSIRTSKTTDLIPRDRAFPKVIPYGGRLYAARNTTTGPQLWACSPGADGACDPADWSLTAPNGIGDAFLTQFNDAANTAITLLAATSAHLYVGFDNVGGMAVFRSSAAAPAIRADFERVGPPGLGISATRVFDAKTLTLASESIYAAVGNGVAPLRLVRLAP